MEFIKRNMFFIVAGIVILTGVGLLLYMPLADYWNSRYNAGLIENYMENANAMSAEDFSDMWAAAEAYNRTLLSNPGRFRFDEADYEIYNQLLAIDDSGLMGYVEVPGIKARLLLYHGTSDAVLQAGAGHIEGSSLPTGGAGVHVAITAHNGMSSAKMFTELTKVKVGDEFTVYVLDRVMIYRVDQIVTVLPDDMAPLAIDEEQDYCTLVTCTPFGVNSHRLLVRGVRV